MIINRKLNSFVCNLAAFNTKISSLAILTSAIFKSKKIEIEYLKIDFDKRNYKVSNRKLMKLFPDLKFNKIEKEIKTLEKNIKKFKIQKNIKTVRMIFYKKFLNYKKKLYKN